LLPALSLALSFAACGAASADLLAYYKAEGNGADSSGQGRTATLIDNAGYRASAPGLGQGFDIKNPTSTPPAANYVYVQGLSGTGAYSLAGSGLTVSAYFNQDTFGNSGAIVNLRDAANNTGFTIEPAFGNPGSVLALVYTSAGTVLLTVPGFAVGEGHYITMVYDPSGGAFSVYRDGTLAQSTPISTTSLTLIGDESFYIGRNRVNGYGFDGLIDEVRVYNNPLNASQVSALVPEPTLGLLPAAMALAGLRRRRA
jgi:Concanavalin A-like lectin/glucanases superfamily